MKFWKQVTKFWKLVVIFISNINNNIKKMLFLIIQDKNKFSLSYFNLYVLCLLLNVNHFREKMMLEIKKNLHKKIFYGLGWFNSRFKFLLPPVVILICIWCINQDNDQNPKPWSLSWLIHQIQIKITTDGNKNLNQVTNLTKYNLF